MENRHGFNSTSDFGLNFPRMDEAVIGLETHAQLKTKSKMWCGCANAFGSTLNPKICSV